MISFNIYPQGHFSSIPVEQRYSAGWRLLQKIKECITIQEGEYSLLLYDSDRVKIETLSLSNSDLEIIRKMLNEEKSACTIACWQEITEDESEKKVITAKCLATMYRNQILKDKMPLELSDEEWVNSLKEVRMRFEILPHPKFLHFVTNPLGYARETIIYELLGS